MTTNSVPLTARPAWKALQAHHARIRDVHLRSLFADDPKRGERLAAEAAGLYLDYSKHRITDETLRLLVTLAEEAGLRARIDAMFRGDQINVTEKRAVLHAARPTHSSALPQAREATVVTIGVDRPLCVRPSTGADPGPSALAAAPEAARHGATESRQPLKEKIYE